MQFIKYLYNRIVEKSAQIKVGNDKSTEKIGCACCHFLNCQRHIANSKEILDEVLKRG